MWPQGEETQELLAEARNGSQPAVNQLLERYRSALQRMVQLRLDQKIRRRVDASDVVQEVLLEANRRLPEYLRQPRMPFDLWLRHIARDRIIDAHRRHRGSAKRSVDREQPLVAARSAQRSTIQLAAQLFDQRLTPAAAATQREMARRIEQAISELDDRDAEMILMRHYEQLSNQEVARVLGVSEPAASMRYLRAVRRLRARLQPEGEG